MKGIKCQIYGRIRTYNKVTYTEKHGNRVWENRILKPKISKKDRCSRVDLWNNGKHKTLLLHRLVANAFLEKKIDTKMTVNHKDGNRFNNRIDNLEWLSTADNIRHAFENDLYPQIHCKLIDKDNKEYEFLSLSRASKFLGRSSSYISNNIRKKKKITNKLGEEYKIIITN